MDIVEENRVCYGRPTHAHCRTCLCPASHPVKLKSRITHIPPPPPLPPCHPPPCHPPPCHPPPCHPPPCLPIPRQRHPNMSMGCCGCRDECYQMPMRRFHCDHKFELLEKWFKRFDFDSNGLLDVFELRTLLNYLGARADEEYCRDLLSRADRDGDGLLTFPEFLLMWRQSQHEEELVEIIRQYDLYPDVLQVEETVRRPRPKPQVIETVRHGHDRHCCGGCESTVIKTIHRTPEREHIHCRTKVLHRSHEKLPILSCYR